MDDLRQGRVEGRKEGRKEGRREGLRLGRVSGEAKLAALMNRLLLLQRYKDVQAAASDPERREQLYREFGIEDTADMEDIDDNEDVG